tara:strand:+ start:38287 stop:38388 length:102 start_codon:yes stop_codon:yes gene_type:complete
LITKLTCNWSPTTSRSRTFMVTSEPLLKRAFFS